MKYMLSRNVMRVTCPFQMLRAGLKEPLMRLFVVYFRFDQLSLKILTRLYTKYALVCPKKILICTFNGINFMEVEQNNNFKWHDFLLCN